jgi:hypothetical protein
VRAFFLYYIQVFSKLNFGVSVLAGSGSNFFLSPILPFSLSTAITSNSTFSHSFTTSITFTTLVGANLEICIIPDFPLNSTIAQVHSMIFAITQTQV